MIKKSVCCAVILALSWINISHAHTVAEEDAFVEVLVGVYQGAPENSDFIDDEYADPEPWLYPTMDSLLSCALADSETGSTWTREERRVAFEHYMSRMAQKDKRRMTDGDMLTCLFAFNICERFCYTNCLAAAKDIIVSEYAPRRATAADFYFIFVEPSDVATDTAIFVATNTAAFSRSDRYYALKHYCQKVAQLTPTSTVFTNTLERLNASRTTHKLYRPLDTLFIARDPTYETSSNRYELAIEALRYAKPNTPNERYFQSITNRLGRCRATTEGQLSRRLLR